MEQKQIINKKRVIISILIAIAIILLCFFSSRFSWFGTSENENVNKLAANDNERTPNITSEADITKINKEDAENIITAVVNTQTTTINTTKAPQTTHTTHTTHTTTEVTTTQPPETTSITIVQTEAPIPAWTEEKCSDTLYIQLDCNSRADAIVGSAIVKSYKAGTKIKVTALTNTSYYKLEDNTYIHSDFLATSKPVTTTNAPETQAPVTTTKPSTTNSNSSINATAFEIEVFNCINNERANAGLKPLVWDATLYTGTTIRVREIRSLFDHVRLDGSAPYTAIDINNDGSGCSQNEYSSIYNSYGENLAAGQTTAKDVVEKWMNSSGHRANILSENYNYTCVAVSHISGTSKTLFNGEYIELDGFTCVLFGSRR